MRAKRERASHVPPATTPLTRARTVWHDPLAGTASVCVCIGNSALLPHTRACHVRARRARGRAHVYVERTHAPLNGLPGRVDKHLELCGRRAAVACLAQLYCFHYVSVRCEWSVRGVVARLGVAVAVQRSPTVELPGMRLPNATVDVVIA